LAQHLLHLRARIDGLGKTLAAVSPLATLERGYAIVTDDTGAIVRDAAAMPAGSRVDARVAHGSLVCRVEEARTESQAP
jgi:exodeoxyribonuclease VII large subunit